MSNEYRRWVSVVRVGKINANLKVVPETVICSKRTSCQERNTLPDELELFTRLDEFNFDSLKKVLLKNERLFSVNICFSIQDSLMVQSTNYENGVPLFLLKIYEDLRFQTFQFSWA